MKKKRLIIKVGSSTLTKGKHIVSRGKIEDLARQILVLREEYEVLIVSSGAIATARQSLHLNGFNALAVKQALAAIGQPILMRIYQEVFNDYGLTVAQCLLSHTDFQHESSRQNILNTLNVLLSNGYIPIINENDTTTTQEIRFGDNDYLAALVAGLLSVDLLILASDIDGLYSGDPKTDPEAQLITSVSSISDVQHMAGESISENGTGGMRSKLKAAQLCMEQGIDMWIVQGAMEEFVLKAMDGTIAFTHFNANQV